MLSQTILVGTGTTKIYACRLDDNGQLKLVDEKQCGKGSSWLFLRGNILYAVNEHEDKIETFAIEDNLQGKWTLKSKVSANGSTPCSLDIDPTGKWLAVANYGGSGNSNFALLPLNDVGIPEEKGAQAITIDGRGPNENRQEHSHCHQVQFYKGHLYVVDLGTDTLSTYRLDETTGEARLVGNRLETKPGAGPRHLLFHPTKPLGFVCNELDSTTSVYRIDSAPGKFEHLQTITTRRQEDAQDSKKENTPAELHLSPDGRLLLVSNREDKNIVVYTLNSDGDQHGQYLSVKEHLDTHGTGARYFTFDPSGRFLLVANEKSNNLISFAYNSDKGTFEYVSQLDNIQSPQHLVFLA